LITKETISVEWLLTSKRTKLFFNVFSLYILFFSMDFSRSTSNQTIIFFSNFCADFGWSSGCHLGDFLIDSIWHKISSIWEYNVTGYPVILEISGHFLSWSLATVMVMSSKPKPHAHRKLFFSCCDMKLSEYPVTGKPPKMHRREANEHRKW